jgi:cysteine-rich repeat protein/predicted outer membrane repeat protein
MIYRFLKPFGLGLLCVTLCFCSDPRSAREVPSFSTDDLGPPTDEPNLDAQNIAPPTETDTQVDTPERAPGVCGNDVVDWDEGCDDGNRLSETICPYGDGTCTRCTADCQDVLELSGPRCGDNNVTAPEICDDGNSTTESRCDGDLCTFCSASCDKVIEIEVETCGNGVPDPGETCDDGNRINEPACIGDQCVFCDSSCSIVLVHTPPPPPVAPVCGDLSVDPGEACDDGNTETETEDDCRDLFCYICIADCSELQAILGTYCGDGQTNGPEVCDDGNVMDESGCVDGECTTCSADCTSEVIFEAPVPPAELCGDGVVQTNELCDDGNTLEHDGCSSTCLPEAIFVDAQAQGSAETGFHWGTAFIDLQSALDAFALQKSSGTTLPIWMAAGTYQPTIESLSGQPRSRTFTLADGVEILGGFSGLGNQRDVQLHATILSGDLGQIGDSEDNAYHVLSASDLGAQTLLDGIEIREGRADSLEDDHGAGLLALNSDLRLHRCTFTSNVATGEGGAIYVEGGSPSFKDSVFSHNEALVGGAVYSVNAFAKIQRSVFFANKARTTGGGITSTGGYLSVDTSLFIANQAVHSGYQGFGGAISLQAGDSTLLFTTFVGNLAKIAGGALFNTGSSPQVVGCLFWDNATTAGGNDIRNNQTTTAESHPALAYVALSSDIQPAQSAASTESMVILNVSPFAVDPRGPDALWNSGDEPDPRGTDLIWGSLDDILIPAVGSSVVGAGPQTQDAAITVQIGSQSYPTSPIDLSHSARISVPTATTVLDLGAYKASPL